MSQATDTSHLITEVQEKGRVLNPTALLKREFIPVSNGPKAQLSTETSASQQEDTGDDSVVRVMQWNLLAQGLCQTSDGFILCPPAALDWNFRQCHVLEELLSYSVDIFCLEELDHFLLVSQYLGKLGFSGLFCPKPDSPCLYEQDNNGPDGCAVFWQESKFKLLEHDKVILLDRDEVETNQVALICKFEGLVGSLKGKQFICAATHLKSKHGYEDLRFQQGSFLEEFLCGKAAGIPLILCGDFNADPDEKVIFVMKNSQLGLSSAYACLSDDKSEPPYTTWKVRQGKKGKGQQEVCHTIDYLFYSTNHFKCIRVLKFPTGEEIGPGFLPSYSYPSDHFSLVADLKLLS